MHTTNTVPGPFVNDEITLTPKAVAEVRRLMANGNIPETHGLRLSVKGGGCSGFSYALGFDEKPGDADKIMEAGGLRQGQILQVRGFADRRPRIADNPMDDSNRRVSIIVQYLDGPPAAAAASPPPAPKPASGSGGGH